MGNATVEPFKWHKMSDAAKALEYVDLFAGGARFPHCKWVEEHKSWVRFTRFKNEVGEYRQYTNVVTNPTHFIFIPEP